MTDIPTSPGFDLTGRRALVTGASSGIGLACAAALAQAGAHVVCAARRPDVLSHAVAAIAADGGTAEALVLDQTDLGVLKAACDAPFDIVVNSAGLARHSPAVETAPDDFDAVMNINLRSAYFLSAYAAEAMMQAGRAGSIIHISSQMGHVGGVDRAVYCATKHGLEGMIKAMAIEWGKAGIRINSICPTFIRTPLTVPTFSNPERLAWIMEKIKLPRVGEVEDIMGAAVFLASDASAMITGTSIKIDGGWTAG
ncbi:MAG: SDR family NAD(P)-dependent oxidoreductase [Roseobacter sp.]